MVRPVPATRPALGSTESWDTAISASIYPGELGSPGMEFPRGLCGRVARESRNASTLAAVVRTIVHHCESDPSLTFALASDPYLGG